MRFWRGVLRREGSCWSGWFLESDDSSWFNNVFEAERVLLDEKNSSGSLFIKEDSQFDSLTANPIRSCKKELNWAKRLRLNFRKN